MTVTAVEVRACGKLPPVSPMNTAFNTAHSVIICEKNTYIKSWGIKRFVNQSCSTAVCLHPIR